MFFIRTLSYLYVRHLALSKNDAYCLCSWLLRLKAGECCHSTRFIFVKFNYLYRNSNFGTYFNILYSFTIYHLDETWLHNIYINLPAVKRRADTLATRRTVKKQWQVENHSSFFLYNSLFIPS